LNRDLHWDLRRDLRLVNDSRSLLENGRSLQAKIGTHRVGLLDIVGRTLVVTRVIGVDVGTVGGVRNLRLEVNARVGRVDVSRHGDGRSCGC
jgi:hypothetical protein